MSRFIVWTHMWLEKSICWIFRKFHLAHFTLLTFAVVWFSSTGWPHVLSLPSFRYFFVSIFKFNPSPVEQEAQKNAIVDSFDCHYMSSKKVKLNQNLAMDEHNKTVIHISTFFCAFFFFSLIYRLLLSIPSTCSLLPLEVVYYWAACGEEANWSCRRIRAEKKKEKQSNFENEIHKAIEYEKL